MTEPNKVMHNKIKTAFSKKSAITCINNKIDLSKLDSSEDTMSYYTYPKEFLKLDLDKIREFIDILEEHYQKMAELQKISEAKSVKQRLILLKNLEKEKMKKEAKIIYSNQRELIQDKMKEELNNYNESANKEYQSLLQVFENHEIELSKAQKQEMNELKTNFDYIYESRRPKPSKEMLNLIKSKNYAVRQNRFDKAEDIEKDIDELKKKENDKFEKEKENAFKEDIKKLHKNHENEKNALLKKKNNLLNMFNQTKNKNIEQIKKKYETKLKELKNYQNFELANFDKITKGITKPSSRIQNIVNSAALVEEGENEEIKNENKDMEKIDKKVTNNENREQLNNQKGKEDNNNINEENRNEINVNCDKKENKDDINDNNYYEEAEEYPVPLEEDNDINQQNYKKENANESE